MNEKDIIVDHVWDCGAYVYITFHKNGEDPSDLIDPGICLDKVSKREIHRTQKDLLSDLQNAKLVR